jgi:hypothetical protein
MFGCRASRYFRRKLGHEFHQPFKRIDFTMLGKKGTSVNHCGQDTGKRVGNTHEIIVL